mgnify:CR=1 FL=1
MRRPPAHALRVILVTALVVLAGCNGLGLSGDAGGGATPSADADAVTPAPVPTTAPSTGTQTGSLADAPPGINESGVVDLDALTAAHLSALANRSFAVTLVSTGTFRSVPDHYTVRVGNGSGTADRGDFGIPRFARNHYLVTTDDGATPLVYGDADARFERDFAFAGSDFVRESDRVTMAPPGTVQPASYGLYDVPEAPADVTRVRRGGETFFRVHVTDPGRDHVESLAPPARAGDARVGTVSNYSLTAYVRADGFVRTVDLTYDHEWNGNRTRIEQRTSYELDTGPLAEPDWVTRTRNGNLTGFDAGEYPPGINESGLQNVRELWDAHRTHLAVTSFTLTRSGDSEYGLLPPPATVAVENRSRFYADVRNGTDRYADRNGTYVRPHEGGLRSEERREYWVTGAVEHGLQWLHGENSTVERVARNGSTLYRLTVERPPGWDGIRTRTVTTTALVRPDGLIREIRLDVTVRNRSDSGWTNVSYRYRYRDVGSTTVSEPDWVARMKRNATVTATPTNRTATETLRPRIPARRPGDGSALRAPDVTIVSAH